MYYGSVMLTKFERAHLQGQCIALYEICYLLIVICIPLLSVLVWDNAYFVLKINKDFPNFMHLLNNCCYTANLTTFFNV